MDEEAIAVPPYMLRRSARRRRTFELSLDTTGGLVVVAPLRTPRYEIDAFVRRKARWIGKARRAAEERRHQLQRDFETGTALPYLGRSLLLRLTEGGAGQPPVELLGAMLTVRLPPAFGEGDRRPALIEALEGWYKARAQETFEQRVRAFAPIVGAAPKAVRVRDQKTRWGSCGRDGTLYFSWRLVLAPPAVVDYLVVHELCHLRRPGHGRAFWALVARALPHFEQARSELRRDGWRYRLG